MFDHPAGAKNKGKSSKKDKGGKVEQIPGTLNIVGASMSSAYLSDSGDYPASNALDGNKHTFCHTQ